MSKTKVAAGSVTTVATGWRETVLICRKCSKKLDGGFGADGGEDLRTAFRDVLRAGGLRGQIRIIETGCFGLCPKKGVTVARGSLPGELVVLGRGADPMALLPHIE